MISKTVSRVQSLQGLFGDIELDGELRDLSAAHVGQVTSRRFAYLDPLQELAHTHSRPFVPVPAAGPVADHARPSSP